MNNYAGIFGRGQQRLLSRCKWRLEQTFSEHSDCCETAERCSTELERLRRERETLVQRLHDIDSDIEKVLNNSILILLLVRGHTEYRVWVFMFLKFSIQV